MLRNQTSQTKYYVFKLFWKEAKIIRKIKKDILYHSIKLT